jgi:hypothetical protein
MNDPLQLPLKDIHLPQVPGWWPPAPGWWMLLGLIIFIAALCYWWRQRQQRIRRSAVHLARLELETLQSDFKSHQDTRKFIADLSILLRRLAISAFPRAETAALTGENWLLFLDGTLENPAFSAGAGRILIEAPYRPEVKDQELSPLIDLCGQWIDQLAKQKAAVSK